MWPLLLCGSGTFLPKAGIAQDTGETTTRAIRALQQILRRNMRKYKTQQIIVEGVHGCHGDYECWYGKVCYGIFERVTQHHEEQLSRIEMNHSNDSNLNFKKSPRDRNKSDFLDSHL